MEKSILKNLIEDIVTIASLFVTHIRDISVANYNNESGYIFLSLSRRIHWGVLAQKLA